MFLSALKKSGLLESIARLFRDGGLAATDFSGLDAPAEGWSAIRDDLHELVEWDQPWEMLGWVRSCDNDAVAKGVLERMSAGSACVLNDVIERLAPEGQDWLRMQALAFDTFRSGLVEMMHRYPEYQDLHLRERALVVPRTGQVLLQCAWMPILRSAIGEVPGARFDVNIKNKR